MGAGPMFGDVAVGGDPDLLVGLDVLQKADEARDAAGAADDAVVNGDGHEAQLVGTLRVEPVESVDRVFCEMGGGREAAVLVAPVAVGFKGVGYDKVGRARNGAPTRQCVIEGIAIVKKTAGIDERRRVLALGRPVIQPTG